MIGMAENYRANVRVVQRSKLPVERKKDIITKILKQIAVLSDNEPKNLPEQVEDLSEEERAILREIYAETQKALNDLDK